MDLDNLPLKIQDWIESSQISDNLKLLAEKYKISEEELYELRRLIILLISGQITLPEFHQNIQDDIQTEDHQTLIQDVNSQIFGSVKEELRNLLSLYQKDKKEAAQAAVFAKPQKSLPSAPPEPPVSFAFPVPLAPTEILRPSFQEQKSALIPKTVHYSDLRTPIQPAFTEKTSAPTIKNPTPITPSSPLPSGPTPSLPNQKSDPLNVVDLKDIPR